MNIFALDESPAQAAEWHCDAHVVKMILETAQLLSGAHHVTTPQNTFPIYRQTHLNHPCSIWTRSSKENYQWLTKLGWSLCLEYTFRYGRVHQTEKVIQWLSRNIPIGLPELGQLSPFALAMPECYRNSNDPVQSYREYYQTKRNGRLGTWTSRNPPWWWNR